MYVENHNQEYNETDIQKETGFGGQVAQPKSRVHPTTQE
jgi:hypothetical protein